MRGLGLGGGSLGGVEGLEVGLHVAAATDVGGDAVEGAAKLEDVAEGQGDGGAIRGATR